MSTHTTHPGFASATPKVPFDFELVTWYDAGSDDDWVGIKEYNVDDYRSPCVTGGFVLGEEKGMLRLAATLAPDFDMDDEPTVTQQMFIPLVLILKRQVLRKADKESS